jgi:hypothetical protein
VAEIRYTGSYPVVFKDAGLRVRGEVFTVPDQDAETYTRRADCEAAGGQQDAEPVRDARPASKPQDAAPWQSAAEPPTAQAPTAPSTPSAAD